MEQGVEQNHGEEQKTVRSAKKKNQKKKKKDSSGRSLEEGGTISGKGGWYPVKGETRDSVGK